MTELSGPSRDEQLLRLLGEMHAAQLKSIELQAQANALVTEHMARYRALAEESVKLQQQGVRRQRTALRLVMLILLMLPVILAYPFFKHLL